MAQTVDMEELTLQVKEVARRQGAALVGVAPVERFEPQPPVGDQAPRGHHPQDFLPEARAVISVAQPVLNPAMDAPAMLADRELEMIPEHARFPYLEAFYNRVAHVVHDYMLEFVGQIVGQHLLARGYQAMIFPTTGLHPRVDGLSDEETWEGPPSPRAREF
jgi:epoxyqueuosine reductase QueG